MTPTIGVSGFAKVRHTPDGGRTHYRGTWEELIALVVERWDTRQPGAGEVSVARKITVAVPPDNFSDLANVLVTEDTALDARICRRQPEEDPYIGVRAIGLMRPRVLPVRLLARLFGFRDYSLAPLPKERPLHANVVLYSAAALSENGGMRSTDCDWEIITILASDVPDEPMHPLTMARNELALTGGTKSSYTPEEYARSIVYWSRRCPDFAP